MAQHFEQLMKNAPQGAKKKKIVDPDQITIACGTTLTIPEDAEVSAVILALQRQQELDEERIEISRTIDVMPWDGCIAVKEVVQKTFGFAHQRGATSGNNIIIPGFYGAQVIPVQTPNGKTDIPWGTFGIEQLHACVHSNITSVNGLAAYELTIHSLGKYRKKINTLIEEIEKYAKTHSIYHGQAMRINFYSLDGVKLQVPDITFLTTNPNMEKEWVYPKGIETAIRTNIVTPIIRTKDCQDNGIPVKRGVLLAGTYGTGKTLAGTVAAAKAVQAGWMFLLVDKAVELEDAMKFAAKFATKERGVVVFCEDIDRVIKMDRTDHVDAILNIIDGADSKDKNIMVILTTNALGNINPAMLRPGRMDAIIQMQPPDAEAAQRLVRIYARELLSPNENLFEVGERLAGVIPAAIREVVERSKLTAISVGESGEPIKITKSVLLDTIDSMHTELTIHQQTPPHQPTMEEMLMNVAQAGGAGFASVMTGVMEKFNGMRREQNQKSQTHPSNTPGNGKSGTVTVVVD